MYPANELDIIQNHIGLVCVAGETWVYGMRWVVGRYRNKVDYSVPLAHYSPHATEPGPLTKFVIADYKSCLLLVAFERLFLYILVG